MSFYYLASPYSKFKGGIEEAFKLACRAAADLVRAGIPVYSPIAHTHPVAMHGGIDPYAHDIWLPADEPFMKAACGLIVLRADGWQESYGIGEEIKAFQAVGKPIYYMDEGVVPVGELGLAPKPAAFCARAAALVSGDRDRTHGTKARNFGNIAAMWNAYLAVRRDPKAPLSDVDVAHLMAVMKIARTQSGSTNDDDWTDGIGYLSIAGHLALASEQS